VYTPETVLVTHCHANPSNSIGSCDTLMCKEVAMVRTEGTSDCVKTDSVSRHEQQLSRGRPKEGQSTRVYPKISGLSLNEINNNNKHPLRSNAKSYGGKTH
jgi:hypothetical protein